MGRVADRVPCNSVVGNSPHFLNESPFHTFAPKFQPELVVDSFDELAEMSAWLGKRYHHFDEISLLFETTQQSPGPRNVV